MDLQLFRLQVLVSRSRAGCQYCRRERWKATHFLIYHNQTEQVGFPHFEFGGKG